MTYSGKYPFADLSNEQIESLMQAARTERSRAIQRFFARLFRTRQAPEKVPAPSLSIYR